jgi:glycosyltransferase involved in cell wall biosynthesis
VDRLSFLVISHAAIYDGRDVFGPAHNVVEHLNACGYDVEFVLHPIHGDAAGVIRSFRGGALVDEQRVPYRGRLREVLSNVRRLGGAPANVVVLIDPLNYVSAVVPSLGRRTRKRVRVYYMADYAERRFDAPLLNAVYHGLDRLALRHTNLVWSVSSRIAELRLEQGVKRADNFVIPNAPSFSPSAVVPWGERRPDSVVFAGMLDPTLDWHLLADAIAHVAAERPDLDVRLVGDGPDRVALSDRLRSHGVERSVEFCGLRTHDETLEVISTSRVGLVLYSGNASWNEFRDSLKVREYVSRGVPVVSTHRHPLADELVERGAGYVVETPEETAAAIVALLDDDGLAATRALAMAADADRTAILTAAVRECERRLAARTR